MEGPVNIVVADDEKTIRELFKETLEGEGYRVFTAQDGQEALVIIGSEDVAALVLDLKMPKVHGGQVLEELMLREQVLPVIVVSAYRALKYDCSVLTYPHLFYLAKPVKIESLIGLLSTLLSQSQTPIDLIWRD